VALNRGGTGWSGTLGIWALGLVGTLLGRRPLKKGGRTSGPKRFYKGKWWRRGNWEGFSTPVVVGKKGRFQREGRFWTFFFWLSFFEKGAGKIFYRRERRVFLRKTLCEHEDNRGEER